MSSAPLESVTANRSSSDSTRSSDTTLSQTKKHVTITGDWCTYHMFAFPNTNCNGVPCVGCLNSWMKYVTRCAQTMKEYT